MRRVLVDWMSDVADDFHFLTETLFLAINYLDRFLGSQKVPRNILQVSIVGDHHMVMQAD